MFCLKNNFVYFTLFYVIDFGRCLVELPAVEDNGIATTAVAISETINNVFALFKIGDSGHKPKLKEFSIIHNFFLSITLKECNNLRNLVRLARVYDLDNNMVHFMWQINEVLNEGDKSIKATDDIYVNTLIENFINKLRDFKSTFNYIKNFPNISVNSKVWGNANRHQLKFSNLTKNIGQAHDSDNEVWKSTPPVRRIFRGHRSRIRRYPFMASVHFFGTFQCGGSIIHKDLVITAASCLQLAWNNRFFRENPAFLTVQVGSDFYNTGGKKIQVMELYFHPEYTPKTLNNNLAVMRLRTHIVFTKRNKHVRLIERDQIPFPLPGNTDEITIIGWGAKDHSNRLYDPWINKLSYARLSYYPLSQCQDVYSTRYVTHKHFCAGFFSKAGGACHHDIGGPGIIGNTLVGVISFGPPVCGTPDAPTVFTKVGFYRDWIDEIINSPEHKKVTTTPSHDFRLPLPTTQFLYTTLKSTNDDTIISNNKDTADTNIKRTEHTSPNKKGILRIDIKSTPGATTTIPLSEYIEYEDEGTALHVPKVTILNDDEADSTDVETTKQNFGNRDSWLRKVIKPSSISVPSPDEIEYENLEIDKYTDKKGYEKNTPSVKRQTTTDKGVINNDDLILENDIKDVLDDLQVRELLESDSSYSDDTDIGMNIEMTDTTKYKDINKNYFMVELLL